MYTAGGISERYDHKFPKLFEENGLDILQRKKLRSLYTKASCVP